MARRPLPDDLPDEVRELIEPHLEPDVDRLASIGQLIAAKRTEAKNARVESGIEMIWGYCEEAYIGIDEANRSEFSEGRWAKPPSPDGPLTREGSGPNDGKSTAYVRLTARYVDAGAAKVGEILLPADDKAFSFDATPLPEFIKFRENPSQIVADDGTPLTRPARPDELPAEDPAAATPAAGTTSPPDASAAAAVPMPAGGAAVPPAGVAAPAQPPQVPLTTKDIADEQTELARKKAKKAEKRIYDWMIESRYGAEMRKVIADAARLGVGVLKGPFPKPKRGMVLNKSKDGGYDLQVRMDIKPAVRWVDPWNIFPDPACGENIADGDYVFERDFLSERQVRDLKKEPGYIAAQIDAVLQAGPGSITQDTNKPGATSSHQRRHQYEAWHFTGTIGRDDMACICQAAGKPLTGKAVPYDKRDVFAIVTMINDHVVKAAFNPLDSGRFPYHSVPWARRTGQWAGIGVAEQISTAQRMINAATRAMLNNAGVSAGPQIVVNREAIEPGNGRWELRPNKIWYHNGEGQLTVEEAFGMFQVGSATAELMQLNQYALRLAEESTNIPLVTQGQSGPTQPDTLGGMQLQNNNANQLLRTIGYAFDDFITEPVVHEFYEWLLLDPDVPADEKGDFDIFARGSAALVERAIQDQTLAQMGAMVLNPAYKMDPAKWAVEFIKSKRFDPRNFQRSEEEQTKLDQQPPPEAPQVTVAKINAASREKIAGATSQLLEKRIGVETTVRLRELSLEEKTALMEFATRRGITLEQVKAELAKTTMQLQTQVRLASGRIPPIRATRSSGRPPRAPQVAPTPMEPVGRAEPGMAFEQ